MSTATGSARRVAAVIGGQQLADPPGELVTSTNPADERDLVAEVVLAGPATLVDACRAARAAQPAWAAVPAPVRGRVVQQIGRLVEANKEALAALLTREIGKPLAESLGEVQEVVDTCDFFLGEGRRLYGQTVPSELPDKRLFTFRRPVGVVVVVTAANFPAAVPSWHLVPALLCGNAVVWKPSEVAPAVASALTELCAHAGLPDGVLNLVHADGEATFAGLTEALGAGLVDKVGFTGSTAVGRRVGELCGRHAQAPCLELGGKNPLVVAADADLDLAVEGALFSGFGTAGQRCTSLGTVWVQRERHDEFLARFAAAVAAAPIGDPRDKVLYGPLLDRRYLATFERWLGLVQPHHRLHGSSGLGRITAANPREGFVGDPAPGLYCHPLIVDGVTIDDELARVETFGPIVGVGVYDTLAEAIELANAPGYGLSAAIYTNDPAAAFRFQEGCHAGMVSVNNSTSGAEAHLPFGGNGLSGNGSRQGGVWVLEQFSRWQAVNWEYSGRLQKAQMDVGELPADSGYRLDW
jgi:aldehyde dehydrogenase (NAD+)